MHRYIRWALTFLVLLPVFVFLETLFHTSAQRFAADKQFDLFVTRWWLTISEFANALAGTEWFWFSFGLLVGIVAALWTVEWFSRR
jgi:hypothetical protein